MNFKKEKIYFIKCFSGFTFVELIITMVMMSVLFAIALPQYYKLVPRMEAMDAANKIVSMIKMGRLRAATTNKPIRLVLDCSKSFQVNGEGVCTVDLQEPIYSLDKNSFWKSDIKNLYRMKSAISVTRLVEGTVPFAGQKYNKNLQGSDLIGTLTGHKPIAPDSLTTAVILFLPTGDAISSRIPLKLSVIHEKEPERAITITVISASGEVILNY